MHIVELTFTVDKHGGMRFPASMLKEMGLLPGDHVRVAYLTQDGVENTFREFMVSSDAANGSDVEGEMIQIPARLMEQASIPMDADLQIVCLNGALVICRDMGLQPEELQAVLEGLQAAEDLTAALPGEAEEVLLELEQTIQNIQEGVDIYE